MSSLKEYLITLLSAKKNIERTVNTSIDYTAKGILDYIAENPSSIDDCYAYLNNNDYRRISYADINKHIHNLIDLGLAQKVTNTTNTKKDTLTKENDEPFGKKSKQDEETYYSITPAGIFYLFATNPDTVHLGVILKNKEDGLFVNFLYSCLEFKSLEKIVHPLTLMHINRFLGRCCHTIRTVLEDLRTIDEQGGMSDIIGHLPGLANPECDDGFNGPRAFIQGLKVRLKIDWLDLEETKIIEVKRSKLFKICDEKKNELTLEIHTDRM